ncbi:MAG: hypothetical protein R2705_23435 [Ilumatobacteraceae bacterium]
MNLGTGVQTTIRDVHELIAGRGAPTVSGTRKYDESGRFALSPVRARIHSLVVTVDRGH